MPDNIKSPARSVLLLENSRFEAQQLRDALDTLPQWRLETMIHLASEGIFPTLGHQFELLLVSDNYACSKLSQIIEIAKFYQPHSHIVLLSTKREGAFSPQDLIDAGRAGVSSWLPKNNLSPTALHTMLQKVFGGGQLTESGNVAPGFIAGSSPPGITAAAAAVPDNRPGEHTARRIVDELSVGIVKFSIVGDDFVYRYINRALANSEHFNLQELIGKRLSGHAVGFENFKLHAALRQVSSDGTPQRHRVMSLHKDASASWREIAIQRLHDGDMLVEIQDVTERVQNDAKRRYDAQIWWRIANSLPDMCAVLDDNGTVTQVVAGDWQQLNVDSEALVGQPITTILSPGERQKCRQSINKALNTSKTQTAVYAVDSLENQFYLHVKVALLRAEVNAPRRAIWVAREISDQHNGPLSGAATPVNSLESLADMLHSAPFIGTISSTDGKYKHASAEFAQLLQQPAQAIIGKTDAELFPEYVALTLQKLDHKLLSEGNAQQCEVTLTPEGVEQNYRVVKIPLVGKGAVTQSIFTVVLPLATAVEPAVSVAADLPQQAVAAQPDAIDSLVSDIARDFNDVLVNLTEHTRLALDDSAIEPAQGEITNYLHAVMNSSQRARDLVMQMMAYQSAEASANPTTAFDLTLFMSGVVGLLRNTIGQHLQISSDLQQNLQVAELDSLRLQNALIQLFRVAQQSFDASGHLSVCMCTQTQQHHECAYCYAKVRGDFVVISMHNSQRTNADAMDKRSADLPQDEALLVQIKRIHELIKPYSGHIVLRGEAGEEQSWHVYLAVDAHKEDALKLYPASAAEQLGE